MRIGINALYLIPGEVGGTERYARRLTELLGASEHDLVVFSNEEAAETWTPAATVVRCPVRGRSRAARIAWEQVMLPLAARRAGIDVLHSLGYTSPALSPCASVVTIHDLNYHFHPEDWSPTGLWAHRVLVPLAAHCATRVLTISESSRVAIRDVLGVEADVVHHGVDGNLAAPGGDAGLAPGFLLSVTATHPHKNLDVLLAAYEALCAQRQAPPLVLVGVAGRDHERIRAKVAGRPVVLLGWVDEARLAALYRAASVFVFASRYEGFGFPVLEAMSAGVPVVSSNATSLPELCGDAALLLSPDDVEGFTSAIARVLDDEALRATLVRRGTDRVLRFSWARAVEETIEVYRKAQAARSRPVRTASQ